MRRFEAIIQSETAPSTSSLWLKDKKLWFFEGGWEPIGGDSDAIEKEELLGIKDALVGSNFSFSGNFGKKVNVPEFVQTYYQSHIPMYFLESIIQDEESAIEIMSQGLMGAYNLEYQVNSLFPSLFDKYLFEIIENPDGVNENNERLLNYIQNSAGYTQESYIPVYLKTANTDIIRSVPAIYHNAHLYSILGGKLKVYNIDTNEPTVGKITELKTVDLTLLPTYIDLELGNSAAVKAYNLEQLQKVSGTQFFVNADFGIGVGSFNSGHGGETTIQTAEGDRVHYQITAEGECRKQEDRFEHSELFFNLGQIDVASLPRTITIRNSVEIAKFKKATSLAFEASNNGSFIDNISMNQVSVNTLTNQRIYKSPDLICVADQGWNYIKASATTYNDRIEIYLETI